MTFEQEKTLSKPGDTLTLFFFCLRLARSVDARRCLWQRDRHHPEDVLPPLALPHPHQGPEGLHPRAQAAQGAGAAHDGMFPDNLVGQQRHRCQRGKVGNSSRGGKKNDGQGQCIVEMGLGSGEVGYCLRTKRYELILKRVQYKFIPSNVP